MKLKNFFLPKYYCHLTRVGNKNDGGYPVSLKVLKKVDCLLSIGLGYDWSFEKESLTLNEKLIIYMYDAQVNFKSWLKKFVFEFFNLILLKKNLIEFINTYINFFEYLFFFKKDRVFHIKKNIISKIETTIKDKNEEFLEKVLEKIKKNILLKVDIEGNEYRILSEIIEHQNKIEFLIIEFHHVDLMEPYIKKFIKKFKLDLVHVHVNNFGGKNKNGYAKVVEAMFSKRKYNKKRKLSKNLFPNFRYDSSNNKDKPEEKILFV